MDSRKSRAKTYFLLRKGVVSVSLLPSMQGVTVEVTDTGSGISTSDLLHVFERFYRVSRTAEQATGAGLALSVSQRMLELHGGQLQVVNKVGVGTTFSFTLPTA